MQIPSTNAKLAFNLFSSSEAFVSTTVSHIYLSNLHSSKTYHSINLDKSLEWEMICLIWTTRKFCLHLFYGSYHNGPCIIYVSLSLGREIIMEGFQWEVLVQLNFDWWLEFNTQRKLVKTHWTEREQYLQMHQSSMFWNMGLCMWIWWELVQTALYFLLRNVYFKLIKSYPKDLKFWYPMINSCILE